MGLTPLSPAVAPSFQTVRWIATDMDGTLTTQGKFTPDLVRHLDLLAAWGWQVLIVTGRSAGWVSGVVQYLPVAGAIAENGGIFIPGAHNTEPAAAIALVPVPDWQTHRQQLAALFQDLQTDFPHLRTANDNPFRLTDWTFDVAGLTPNDLDRLSQRCQAQGWSITYSTVQVHLKRPDQSKAAGLSQVLTTLAPGWTADQVLTVGDSPNDESLFDPAHFPQSVGVANVQHYRDRLTHLPTYVTAAPEGTGFCQLAEFLMTHCDRPRS